MLNTAQNNDEVRTILNSASVNLCDGIGVKIISKMIGTPIQNKVPGIDFGERLLALAEKEGASVFLLGGKRGVAKKAREEIRKKHPAINICSVHHGYFGDAESDDIFDKINKSGADILIVCRGFPLQERFVFENRERLCNVKVFACLGGALDVWSGMVERAPEIVQRINCEWLWRIMNEPERSRRFLSSLPILFHALWN